MTVQPNLVSVYVVNGIRTSGGMGPGPVRVPPEEAANLVALRVAVSGDRPPQIDPQGLKR
jgi:hypothetical protein